MGSKVVPNTVGSAVCIAGVNAGGGIVMGAGVNAGGGIAMGAGVNAGGGIMTGERVPLHSFPALPHGVGAAVGSDDPVVGGCVDGVPGGMLGGT